MPQKVSIQYHPDWQIIDISIWCNMSLIIRLFKRITNIFLKLLTNDCYVSKTFSLGNFSVGNTIRTKNYFQEFNENFLVLKKTYNFIYVTLAIRIDFVLSKVNSKNKVSNMQFYFVHVFFFKPSVCLKEHKKNNRIGRAIHEFSA